MKRILTIISALAAFAISASAYDGGIKAKVVNRSGRVPVQGATVSLSFDDEVIKTVKSAPDGSFFFEDLPDGRYTVSVDADEFLSTKLNVTVENGIVRDLMFVTLSAVRRAEEVDASNFAEFDLDDSGYTDAPTILFSTNDVYTDVVGYGFSNIRFKNRGYNSETQDVYLAGVPMNDAITGYSPFSLWSGLNEAMRSKDSTLGLEMSDFGNGGYNGVTNITAVPSAVRTGWRFSVLSNSALYRLRLMASYSSGELDNGWSYAFNASARLGGNDWVKGVYYRNFALYGGIGKKFDDVHKLSLFAFATPGQRGAQNSSTQ